MIFRSNVILLAAIAATSLVVTGVGVVVAQHVATVGSSTNADMNTKLLVGEGMKRLRDQKPLEAISLFEQAQTSAADDELRAEIWYWLGEAYQRAGKGDEATRCWKEMTWQHPTSRWTKFARGRLTQVAPPASGTAGSSPVAPTTPVAVVTGNSGKVFKPIDTARPGFYVDGKWSYSYTIAAEGPQQGYRQGFLKYDLRELLDPQPGDFILTPWGWMQWQDRPTRGNWLPVAEKPAKGKQLPDLAR